MADYDVIIVGAGVVGSALGYALGKQGRRVAVVERDLSEPDRIVGELLQPGGVNQLRELGLEHCIENIDAPEVHGYAIFFEGKGTKLRYPNDKKGNLQIGSSFHHGKFITKLREALRTVSNVEVIEGSVGSILEVDGKTVGVTYKTKTSEVMNIHASLTILCDGCNSDLRRNYIPDKPEHNSRFYGLIIKDTPLPFPNHGHVILTRTGPVLAYQIGTHDTRFLVDISSGALPKTKTPGDLHKYLLEVTAPQLPESLRASFEEAVTTAKHIPSMANQRLDPTNAVRPGLLLLGDSFNMRHPLTGGGMTVGLSDAVTARNLLATVKDLTDTPTLTRTLQRLHTQRKGYSSTINILSWALYHVFTATNDPILPEMRKACIAYLALGGEFTNGPMSLLSGVKPYPTYLMIHFFAVALFGVARILLPFPTPRRILNAYRLLSAASNIVVPLVRCEKVLPLLPILCRLMLLTGGKPKPQA